MNPPFTLVNGRSSLALAETLQAAHTEQPVDLLTVPEALGEWVVHAGVLDSPPPVSARALRTAHRLRAAIRDGAAQLIDAQALDPATADTLNAIAGAARPVAVRLLPGSGIARTGPIEAALATVAVDAILVLGGPDAPRLRRCESERCRVVFVDDTRAGTRRWCDMTVCGNRAKVAAHRRRSDRRHVDQDARPDRVSRRELDDPR